jgi:predicted helicase
MSQMEKPNLALLTTRRVTRIPFNNIFTTNKIVEYKIASHDRNTIVFPLYYYPELASGQSQLFDDRISRVPNLSKKFIEDFEKAIRLKFIYGGTGDLRKTFGPEDVFHYIYAVFHSPAYRQRYAEFLKIDFPRLPLTSNVALFRQLCGMGKELVALHLLEAPVLEKPITKFTGWAENSVAKGYPKYQDDTVLINPRKGFEGVPSEVWEFHVGGYQVCQKWLKDRRGRQLSAEDIAHYQKIVVALKETIRLMGEVDEVIESAGGWPVK